MTDQTLSIDGVRVPRFLYGTAWKEQETQRLTEIALGRGFRGIDTANQRRHYDEAAVGRAVGSLVEGGLLAREDLFGVTPPWRSRTVRSVNAPGLPASAGPVCGERTNRGAV